MSPRSKKLNDLLNELGNDLENNKKEPMLQDTQKVSGININIGGIGDNNSISIGNISTTASQSANDIHTTSCKACSHVVAKAAKSCPNCGQPITSKFKKNIILGAMLLAPFIASPSPFFGFIH